MNVKGNSENFWKSIYIYIYIYIYIVHEVRLLHFLRSEHVLSKTVVKLGENAYQIRLSF